ncbi:xanthine dehydrogenase small subunit [Microlunatus sagamiharensis]|uniref:Xanthine dehydrogenase small subunit n=1 Tax=Microlunatus sagamiharensis TaxID=546874 RepID=A0A1H2MXH2_9ACTN|nr:FAD binding domain-containing protein [Microlunatus sagamiharensis]SDU97256.1 xanthine dehydrogenase small subunit [Microlunatus sagamiharensis]
MAVPTVDAPAGVPDDAASEVTVAPSIVVNGRERRLGEVGGHVTLLDWLRTEGLTGSKEGCAEGECGACAVMVLRPDSSIDGATGPGASTWVSINACLAPAAALDGQEVRTAEGLGRPDALHPVQREMADRGGSQCGYCTPGFVCSMAAEYYRAGRSPVVDGQEPAHEHGPNGFDLHALSGNLCRCTGYRPIRDAAYALGAPDDDDALLARTRTAAPAPRPTRTSSPLGSFVRPASLDEALALLAAEPDARLLAGSTDWGVELNLRHSRTRLTVALDRLPELRTLAETDEAFEIGASLTLSEVERGLDGRVPLLAELFPQFASRLIRNAATFGGNLGTASPIGDSMPVLLALDARLVLASAAGERTVGLADYFTGYRASVRRPDELIRTVVVPKPLAPLVGFHKIAKRRFDDISSVSVAFALTLDGPSTGSGSVVAQARIGLGGVAATPVRALMAEQALVGRPFTAEGVAEAAEALGSEGTPLDDHRASARYRRAMLRQSLLKLVEESR